MILLTEYRANSIRLRRVLLLRSDIRLTPSYICYASLGRIEYHRSRKASISLSLCDNITLCVSKEYHFIPTEKEIAFRRTTDLLSLSACVGVSRSECNELWGFTYKGSGLAHSREPLKFYEFLRNPEAHLSRQMRCLHFC